MELHKHDIRRARALIAGLAALHALALALAAALILPLIVQWHARDIQIYYETSAKLLGGQLPYRDFSLEYPPLAIAAFLLPWLPALGRAPGYSEYAGLFLAWSALLSMLIALALAQVAALARPDRSPMRALAAYALLAILGAPLITWRYDLFPALLTLLALLCVLRERPALAGACLGLGVAAKLYPAAPALICAAYYLANRSYRSLLKLAAGGFVAILAALLPFLLIDPGGWLSFLRYHQMRGLQLESLPAGVILLAQLLGRTRVELVYLYGALQLVSPLADLAALWQPLAFSLAIGAVFAGFLARFRRERAVQGVVNAESLVAGFVAALLAFIVTNKVFSAQYIVWLLPFAPLLRPRKIAVLAAICALTIAIFPFDYADLLAMQAGAIVLLNLRNALTLALLGWLLFEHLPERVRAALALRRPITRRPMERQGEL